MVSPLRPAPPPNGSARPRRDRLAYLAVGLLWCGLGGLIAMRRSEPVTPHLLPSRPVPPVTIDLNRDAWPRLLLIEGIGEALARRIVRERELRGGFGSLAEVQAIPGVPDRAIERARPWLRLGTIGSLEAERPGETGVR